MSLPAFRAATVEIPLEPLPDPVAGAPRAGNVVIEVRDGQEIGVWEMTPGAARDVEADEVFIVLSGRATVVLDDDPESVLSLEPGDVVRLEAGMRTLWTVTETLRKVYLTAAD